MYRLVYSITTLLIGYITIYVFDAIVFDISNDPVINTMHYDGKINSYIIFGVFVLLSQFFLKKIIKLIKWKIITSILFVISLEEAFFEIAYSLRAEFGTTWTNMEVRFTLVFGFKETFLLIFVAVTLYILLLWFIKNNKIHKAQTIN